MIRHGFNQLVQGILIVNYVGAGVRRPTNLMGLTCTTYKTLKRNLSLLVDLDYLCYDSNNLMLTSRGKELYGMLYEYRDLFSEVFYTRPYLKLFEAAAPL